MAFEHRRSPRVESERKIRITYVDEQGRQQFENVPVLDVSASGCRVVLQFRCLARTVVTLSFATVHSGSATVRYQRTTARGYVTGLEFLGGLALSIPAPGVMARPAAVI